MHRIVVPLDGSGLAEAVMPTAVELGQALGAEWVLVRVVTPQALLPVMEEGWWEPVGPMDPIFPLTAEDPEDARRYLETVRARMPAPERVQVDVREDWLPGGILSAVQEHGATFVALSTHGRGGWRRLVMGSVAEQIIRTVPVPVVVVHPVRTAGSGKSGATGGSDGSSPASPDPSAKEGP